MLAQQRPSQTDAQLEGVPDLLARIYRRRGIDNASQIGTKLQGLLPPSGMRGMDAACARLHTALLAQENIIIVGDFDADGATSCALAMLALRNMGFHHLSFLVPNRFEFGYGLTPEIVDVAYQQSPHLIITVDNGIASIAGVDKANSLGIDVIVTDHHLPGEQQPNATAILNPNQLGCNFGSKSIAGVGVFFYLMLGLRGLLRQEKWFTQAGIAEPNLADWLDLVALGTVADVVPLDHNNRILVEQGLRRIRAGRCRPGITALLEIAKRNPASIVATDLGFAVGPRLNAAGRLDDMSLGIQCLLTADWNEAREAAAVLDDFNKERRSIEAGMQQQAEQVLAQLGLGVTLPPIIVLYQPGWHQGVVGIVASRLKEQYHRPVMVFADADTYGGETGGQLKGSARSIPGFHMRDALDLVAKQIPDVLSKFGGHAMAAGASIKAAEFELFKSTFEQVALSLVNDEMLTNTLLYDEDLDADLLTEATADLVQSAGPWGQAFPVPIFKGRFTLVQQRLVGGNHLKLVLAPESSPQNIVDAIWFRVDVDKWPNEHLGVVEVFYQLDINEFRGQRNIQLMVQTIQPLKN